jgi:uncharacterized membrane protein HdeD (DUF308 family)
MNQMPYSLKAFLSWSVMIAATVLTLWVALVSVTSLWVGVKYMDRFGSWMPIVSGATLLVIGLWVYLRVTTSIYRRLRREDMLDG